MSGCEMCQTTVEALLIKAQGFVINVSATNSFDVVGPL